jgi:hypothetical protein
MLGYVVYEGSWRYTCSPKGCALEEGGKLLFIHRVHYQDYVSVIL